MSSASLVYRSAYEPVTVSSIAGHHGPAALVFLLLAAVWVSSTVAVAPCSDVIIAGLSQHDECYPGGVAPSQQAGTGTGTHIVAPKNEFAGNVDCVTARSGAGHAYVNVFYKGGSNVSATYGQVVKKNYIEETDSGGKKYRLYVIRNAGAVYAYYRCAEQGKGTGAHSVHVAVGCAYAHNPVVLAAVDKVKQCFNKLLVTNYVPLKACQCS